jgi:hypothetical protein
MGQIKVINLTTNLLVNMKLKGQSDTFVKKVSDWPFKIFEKNS